jgi:biotin carboxyl carrier protein
LKKCIIQSEITGTVWKIVCSVGEAVAKDQELVILESMKMEIPVLAEGPGVVAQMHVAEGDVVQEGDLIAVIG